MHTVPRIGNSKAEVKVAKKSKDTKKETNKGWNAETIWILSPLIPFFIPLKAPLWWRHSDLTSETSGPPAPPPSATLWYKLNSWLFSHFHHLTLPQHVSYFVCQSSVWICKVGIPRCFPLNASYSNFYLSPLTHLHRLSVLQTLTNPCHVPFRHSSHLSSGGHWI
jgi:hypothetical protein